MGLGWRRQRGARRALLNVVWRLLWKHGDRAGGGCGAGIDGGRGFSAIVPAGMVMVAVTADYCRCCGDSKRFLNLQLMNETSKNSPD